ncbi:hypothetical protein ACH5RR_031852 [Cinchona calisaya]|uniref:Uncharacterized protein n=1 Tax=Cinchona calisaya TaxID=153742 RepID=A0ABD2YKN9_9GENT
MSADALHMLIQFPLFVDIERNPSFVCLSLLKGIMNRKLVVPETYDVVKRVAELMVICQMEPIRKFIEFLQYCCYCNWCCCFFVMSFLQVSSKSNHRQCLCIWLFPDHDNKIRSMTGAAIKLLIGHVSSHSHHSILEYSLSWYVGRLWSAATQVLGLLVEVMDQLDVSGEAAVPMWKEAYYSLVLLEKILNQFQKLSFEKDFEQIWEMICEFLLHPHLWLCNISNRLVPFYFSHVTEAYRETLFSMTPSRLFLVAALLCCQLKTQPTDDAAGNLIAHNLVFTICHLHTLLGQIECMDISYGLTLMIMRKFVFLKLSMC